MLERERERERERNDSVTTVKNTHLSIFQKKQNHFVLGGVLASPLFNPTSDEKVEKTTQSRRMFCVNIAVKRTNQINTVI
jgi:hypothetical protein